MFERGVCVCVDRELVQTRADAGLFLYLRSFLWAAEAEQTALGGALAQRFYSAVDCRNNKSLNVVLWLFLEHSAQRCLTAGRISAFICSARRLK